MRAQLERFIGLCWDAGLEIGSSVRKVAECVYEAAGDVTIQTALIESRWICGAKATLPELMAQVRAGLDANAFFTAKTLEMQQRHQRFENTPYALEPNCKE